jgi:uncharacterized membrane protein
MSDTENTTPESTSEETQAAAAQPETAQPAAEAQTAAEAPADTEQPEEESLVGVALMIAAFGTEDAGDKALKAMKKAKKEGQFYYDAAAVIKKEADGDVHYHETGDMSTGKGAGIGALIGGVIGILGGPVGIGLGAAAGALHGKSAIPGRWIANLSGRTAENDDGRVFELLNEAEKIWGFARTKSLRPD